jgi:NAD(P)-dependent dehydrogenase (short-subunit alcohol dehydrogenase family)
MATFIMTGGTSGFGKIALQKLMNLENARIFLGARNKGPKGVETIPLDLTKLDNVRSFASEVCNRIGSGKIDGLIFNAGVSLPGGNKTMDGFETTFAVNHLAHYLLLRLLLPKLASGARIILTTSGTYDPAEKTIIPPPLHANAKLLAYPELDTNLEKDPKIAGGRAYSSSKLCTILTVRSLAMIPETVNNKWTVVAYDPGPTPGTKLVRNNTLAVRILWKILGNPLLHPFLPEMNSRISAGGTLAKLALGEISLPQDRVYIALRKGKITYPELSELARRDDLMYALWNDSASLVGIS